MPNDCPVRGREPAHGCMNLYLSLIGKYVCYEEVNGRKDLILLHEDIELKEARQIEERTQPHYAEQTASQVVLNGLTYQMGSHVSLAEMYASFENEFQRYRPQLTGLKTWFLDDVA